MFGTTPTTDMLVMTTKIANNKPSELRMHSPPYTNPIASLNSCLGRQRWTICWHWPKFMAMNQWKLLILGRRQSNNYQHIPIGRGSKKGKWINQSIFWPWAHVADSGTNVLWCTNDEIWDTIFTTSIYQMLKIICTYCKCTPRVY